MWTIVRRILKDSTVAITRRCAEILERELGNLGQDPAYDDIGNANPRYIPSIQFSEE